MLRMVSACHWFCCCCCRSFCVCFSHPSLSFFSLSVFSFSLPPHFALFLAQGLSPAEVIDGFNLAAKKALEILSELTCYTVKNAYDKEVCVSVSLCVHLLLLSSFVSIFRPFPSPPLFGSLFFTGGYQGDQACHCQQAERLRRFSFPPCGCGMLFV